MRHCAVVVLLGWLAAGCATTAHQGERTLHAPPGTPPAAVAAVEEGNRLFAARQWGPAKAQYEAAIRIHPSLAEAHYNLALVLETLGDGQAARSHYMEAATLAPGHKIIWDSPPLREYGNVPTQPKSGAILSPVGGGAGAGY